MALGTPGSTVKVRRRLDFVKKPLEGESLYLDLPGYRNAKELEGDLKFLGARIETFLTREISYVVTNRKEALTVRPDGGPSSPSPYLSPSPSPGGDEGPQGRRLSNVPLTRGQALLQKAQGRGRRGSCNMLSLAQEWGVKVLYVRDVMAKVQRLMEKYRLLAESEENAACPAENADVKPKRLRPPFIKVEDMSRLYRPLHHEFSSFPRIYFDADNDCPFDAPCHRLPSRPSCSLKLKPQTPATATKPDVQKGYCECCEVYYQEGLSLHLKGDKHQSFVRDNGNFVKLDSLLATLPSLDEFFKKVVEENPQDEDMTAQEEQMSISPAVMEEITEKPPRSSTEGSDDVFLLSDVGDEQAHVQSFQQPTNQVTDQKTERPNREGDNITFNASNKPPKEEIRNDKKSNKDELFPVVVLSPMPNFRSSRQSGNSTSTQRRDSTFENRRCTSIRGEMKCDAVKEEQGLMTDKYNSNDEGDDQSHYRPEVISISSSSSFSIDASSSSHLSSSTSSYHSSRGNETSSTSASVVKSRTIARSNDVTLNDVTLKATNKDSQDIDDIDVQDQHQSVHHHQKVRDEVQLQSVQGCNMMANGCQNSADVTSNTYSFTESTSSSSEAEDLSSSSSSSSSFSSSVRPNRQRRTGSAILESTPSSSDQDNNPSSPQAKILTINGNCTGDAKQHAMTTCCDPGAAGERTLAQERSLATLGSTAAWAVAQSDELALRLCKAKTGEKDEFVSPTDTDREWSVVERSGNLRVKLQRSSCRAKTPRSAHRASELQWSVHRSGDCKLTFSGSLRKQQRRPGMDSPQNDRNFGSRRKLKYL